MHSNFMSHDSREYSRERVLLRSQSNSQAHKSNGSLSLSSSYDETASDSTTHVTKKQKIITKVIRKATKMCVSSITDNFMNLR
jgi:hypothetical protein